MSIQVHDWSREAARGSVATVTFALEGAGGVGRPVRPVVELRLDAIGDGLAGVTVRGDDLRPVTGLALPMLKAGTHSLHVWAIDSAGCSDETAVRREVVVQ